MRDYLGHEMKLRLKRNEAWDRLVECVLYQEGCGGEKCWADYVKARDELKRFAALHEQIGREKESGCAEMQSIGQTDPTAQTWTTESSSNV